MGMMSDINSENATYVFTPPPDTFTVAAAPISKGSYPERIVIIMEGDPDWVTELSGLAIYRSNHPDAPNDYLQHNEISVPVSTYDPYSHNRYEVEVYVPFGVNYEVMPYFGTKNFPKRYSEVAVIVGMEEFIVIKEAISIPMCSHFIPHKNSEDAELELYDYPYTILPLEHSCTATELGHSPKYVGQCNFVASGKLSDCSAYKPFEDVVVAKVGPTEVVLSRKIHNGDIISEYKINEDLMFYTFAEVKKYAEEENLTFELIWSPISKPVTFLDKIVGRLEVTYPHEKV
jgi:hypothetical protein